ncbi:hypothetical protein NECAME_00449 [Necator americanus]|uniref:Uncharacterized protein n=1 Tax=Necator americanus TaxID=51031 RepID=W2T5N8_NECAM|nr:hypothetical protein NECAME_00449 [Necator americanus]ETN76924.1 hypothetical protein NECAME_00449 [Necator americanus]
MHQHYMKVKELHCSSRAKNFSSPTGQQISPYERPTKVLVVADSKMHEYHGYNLESYILTLFSTVASIYRHQSLRASINVVVVKIIILKHENGIRGDCCNQAPRHQHLSKTKHIHQYKGINANDGEV